MVQLNGLSQVAENATKKEETMSQDVLMEQLKALQARLDAISGGGVKKNQKPGKADPNRKYVLLSKKMKEWGNIPQQQADLADLLSKNMEVGKEYTEPEVFNILIDGAGEYQSLYKSVQDVTYLFRYYRGLKNDGKRGSFVARDFLRG